MAFLDCGMVAEIPPEMLRPWTDVFLAMAQGDGPWAAELFYVHAPLAEVEDYERYEREISEKIGLLYRARLGDVEISQVIGGLMDVLRRHRVQIDPVFTNVNVALLVAEGLGKQLDPEIDLLRVVAPYLLAARLAAPPGRKPRRDSLRKGGLVG
ncbi:MAG: hypothetical protein N2515_10660 [Deltaproteobacteria bacterium]|nr:hypothetical protein [Deltaproteobacteria bacterium]